MDSSNNTDRAYRLGAGLIILGAFLIRMIRVADHIWHDEIYTAYMVRMPIDKLFTVTVADVHPPTWYLICKPFVALLGETSLALRLPSVLLGTLAVWLVWRVARQLIDAPGALLATGIMALSPMAIDHSDTSRMYMLLTVGVMWAVMGIIENNRVDIAIGTAITLLSHNIAIIYMPGLALVAWMRMGHKAIAPFAIGAIPWLAWTPFLLAQVGDLTTKTYWIADYTGNQVGALIRHISAVVFSPMTPEFILPQTILITIGLIIFETVAVARIVRAGAKTDLTPLHLWIFTFAPPICLLAISYIWQPMIIARTMTAIIPTWAILTAWLIRSSRLTASRVALATVVCIIALIPTSYYLTMSRNPAGEDALAWLTRHPEHLTNVCHGSLDIEYHTDQPIQFNDTCTTLIWIGDLIEELPNQDIVQRWFDEDRATLLHSSHITQWRYIKIYALDRGNDERVRRNDHDITE